jgi:hypothetical protein
MKRRILFSTLSVIVIAIVLAGANSCTSPKNSGKELVLLYDVPLACGAAPDIGCGSRAKPVFVEAEQHPDIKEIWLNRSGTVIAVVGNPSTGEWKQLDEDIAPIFRKYDVRAAYVDDRNHQDDLMRDFRAAGRWYKGVDVDNLSIEEAGRMAEKAVEFARSDGLIDEVEAVAIRSEVENFLKEDLVKVRNFDELCESEEPRYDAVYKIYQRHIGNERALKVRKHYEELQSDDREE